MLRVLCYFGRHAWEHKRNPELGGRLAEFDVCRRCRKEKDVFDKPSGKGLGGLSV